MSAPPTRDQLDAAYERRIAELRAANAGPLELFTDPELDALDEAMRADEAHGGLDE